MAMAAGSRVVIGRASMMIAMAAMSTSSSLSFLRSQPPPPSTFCPNSSLSHKSSAVPSQLRVMRCQLHFSRGSAAIPSRPMRTAIVASSSASATSVDDPLASPSPQPVEVDTLDIRVGRVVKAWKHPEADSLYVEEVDLAEPEGPRTICSGLVNYMSLEELQGRAVLVLANLKPRNMRGVKSNGMLLAASNAEHTIVQLLSPPEGSAPGERVWFGEETEQSTQSPAGTPNQVQKKKIWETVQPLLKTTEECVAVFQSKRMRTSAGVVSCQSLPGANIS